MLNIAKLIDETNDEEAKDALKEVMQALVMSLISIKSTKQEIH